MTYFIVALGITFIIIYNAMRNLRFLARYARLISRAHIDVKTTPLGRLRMFYIGTIPIIVVVYLGKTISLAVFDCTIFRPDLFWGSFELLDTALIIWLSAFVFPMRRSPLYVNMSNMSNERLTQAETWRVARRTSIASVESTVLSGESGARIVQGGSTAATGAPSVDVAGVPSAEAASVDAPPATTDAVSVDTNSEAHPPWVAWTSGMPLPQPDETTWGGFTEGGQRLRRQPVLLPTTIVLGSPCEANDSVLLSVGWPIIGPLTRPAGITDDASGTFSELNSTDPVSNDDDNRGDMNSNRTTATTDSCVPFLRGRRYQDGQTASATSPNGGDEGTDVNDTESVQFSALAGDEVSQGRVRRIESAQSTIANLVRSESIPSTGASVDGEITSIRNV